MIHMQIDEHDSARALPDHQEQQRSFEKFARLQNQPVVEPHDFKEQKPLAKSQIILTDYVQGQDLDGL